MEKYFAQIDENNIVTDVSAISIDDSEVAQNESSTFDFIKLFSDLYQDSWVETFKNVEGKTFAGIGFTWNGTDFIPPIVDKI
jgi:hypothetical protein